MYVLGSVSRLSNPTDLSILVLMSYYFDYCLVFWSTSWKCHPLQMALGIAACFSQTRIHVLNTESAPWSELLVGNFLEPQGAQMEQFDARFWFLVQQTARPVETAVCPVPSLLSAQQSQMLATEGSSLQTPQGRWGCMSGPNIAGRYCEIIITLYWKPSHFSKACYVPGLC